MVLETNRLKITPLNAEQFQLLLEGVEKLEKNMELTQSGISLDEQTQQAMEVLYKESLLHSSNYFWYTNWQIILKSENKSIGSACFMEEPNCEGQVEIGYGIHEPFRNNGFMSEAITCICQWAFYQKNVKSIIAETDINNFSSQKVLEKLGMRKYLSSMNSIWWKIENKI